MPRLRKGPNVQPRAAAVTFTLDVEHQGTIVSIPCGDGTRDLAWLAKQAETQLNQSSAMQVITIFAELYELTCTHFGASDLR